MPVRRIPLFPLNVVAFPRTALPLRIFEERRKEMVAMELTRYLAACLPRQRQIQPAKGLAPWNGHAQAPAEPER